MTNNNKDAFSAAAKQKGVPPISVLIVDGMLNFSLVLVHSPHDIDRQISQITESIRPFFPHS